MASPVVLAAPSHTLHQPSLFLDVQHGLCNRLRVLASGHVIAAATGRRLILVWCPDDHCHARLGDLIRYTGPLIEDRAIADLFRARAGRVFNYMETEPDAAYQEPILADPTDAAHRDVYVRSAYSLTGPHVDFEAEQQFLHSLRPVDAVQAMIAQVPSPAQVAVHIRMGTGPGFDHLSHESPKNWPAGRHDELVAWRAKSHVSRFIERLDVLRAEGRADTIFAAADLSETYETLVARYGDSVRWLPRDLFDRSAEQLQYALADLFLLTRADLFLASTWSSFSDVAQRLAPYGRAIEKSGIDF